MVAAAVVARVVVVVVQAVAARRVQAAVVVVVVVAAGRLDRRPAAVAGPLALLRVAVAARAVRARLWAGAVRPSAELAPGLK